MILLIGRKINIKQIQFLHMITEKYQIRWKLQIAFAITLAIEVKIWQKNSGFIIRFSRIVSFWTVLKCYVSSSCYGKGSYSNYRGVS